MGVLKSEEVASLYRRYAGMVYQIGLMLLKNAPDAEDAVQTVFRRAMERDEPFGGPDHERAWLIVTLADPLFVRDRNEREQIQPGKGEPGFCGIG